MQDVLTVGQVAVLPFGIGKVGFDRHLTGNDRERYIEAMGRCQHRAPSGIWLPIDCMDERPTRSLADGTTDPTVLARRRAYQLAGGTVLATTKAAVAANAAYLRDAKNIRDAYEKTYKVLKDNGIPDAAHEGCGASAFVEKSVSEPVAFDVLLDTFAAMGTVKDDTNKPLSRLAENKLRKLDDGFYGTWSPVWHAEFVRHHHPENFSTLLTADDEVHGHHASGLLVVKDGHYFAKNEFYETSGFEAFALTFSPADTIAHLLGTTTEERQLISLAFRDDSFNVTNHIVAEGLEVFA